MFVVDPRVANTFRTCMQDLPKQCEYPVVVIGTTSSANKLAADVHETFLHQLQIEVSMRLSYFIEIFLEILYFIDN